MRLSAYGQRQLMLLSETLREMVHLNNEGAAIESNEFKACMERAKALMKEFEDESSVVFGRRTGRFAPFESRNDQW